MKSKQKQSSVIPWTGGRSSSNVLDDHTPGLAGSVILFSSCLLFGERLARALQKLPFSLKLGKELQKKQIHLHGNRQVTTLVNRSVIQLDPLPIIDSWL